MRNLKYGLTANGALAFTTTGDKNLDLFSVKGAMRNNEEKFVSIFKDAFREDPILAMCNLLHLRDIKKGLGERQLFREGLKVLPKEAVEAIMEAVSIIGRWDDILDSHDIPAVVYFVKKQLREDISRITGDTGISLLGKWMPSINASNRETVKLGKIWANKLGLTHKDYRKMLSALRAKIRIVENNLREKDYSFDYNSVPVRARMKYRQAFMRNDSERYTEFVDSLNIDDTKSELAHPHEIVKMYEGSLYGRDEVNLTLAEKMWEGQKVSSDNGNTIVVRDGSGSMCWGYSTVAPIDVATSLAILFSEHLTGPFKDTFITFSSRPQLVKFQEGMTLGDKLRSIKSFTDMSNTDIEAVYELIYTQSLLNGQLSPENQISRIVIISDMEFDSGAVQSKGEMTTVSDNFRDKFEMAGLKFPEIIYWNVSSDRVNIPVSNIDNVRLVSGFSSSVINSIINNDSLDAKDMMFKTLAPYIELINADVINRASSR